MLDQPPLDFGAAGLQRLFEQDRGGAAQLGAVAAVDRLQRVGQCPAIDDRATIGQSVEACGHGVAIVVNEPGVT
jgi:hypothetical protein